MIWSRKRLKFLFGGGEVRNIFLRPCGLLYGTAARRCVDDGLGLWLAGSDIAFSLCEIIEGQAGAGSRRLVNVADLESIGDAAIRQRLDALIFPRAAIAGLDWRKTRLAGIVNVTPDSFSDGGKYMDAAGAIAHGKYLAQSGADMLDIGGESTRPGAAPVPPEEELARVARVIEGLKSSPAALSIDTRNANVMTAALQAGAVIINDVSALTHDDAAMGVAAASDCAVILMHARSNPVDMQDNPRYKDVSLEIFSYLEERIEACMRSGIGRERIIVDPGLGFGKTTAHNLELLKNLSLFHGLGCVIMLGASRKNFIGELSGEKAADRRVAGSLGAALGAAARGAQMLRVHDVAQTRQCLAVIEAIQRQ